ncbi:MAG: hypothetical protein WC717_05145, partial [Candidatus Micrarchaeia archaeon]
MAIFLRERNQLVNPQSDKIRFYDAQFHNVGVAHHAFVKIAKLQLSEPSHRAIPFYRSLLKYEKLMVLERDNEKGKLLPDNNDFARLIELKGQAACLIVGVEDEMAWLGIWSKAAKIAGLSRVAKRLDTLITIVYEDVKKTAHKY